MDLAGFCDKSIIVSDGALHCELVRGVKPFFGSKIYYRTICLVNGENSTINDE